MSGGGTLDGRRLEEGGCLQNIGGYRNGRLDKLLLAGWFGGSFSWSILFVQLIAARNHWLFSQSCSLPEIIIASLASLPAQVRGHLASAGN